MRSLRESALNWAPHPVRICGPPTPRLAGRGHGAFDNCLFPSEINFQTDSFFQDSWSAGIHLEQSIYSLRFDDYFFFSPVAGGTTGALGGFSSKIPLEMAFLSSLTFN